MSNVNPETNESQEPTLAQEVVRASTISFAAAAAAGAGLLGGLVLATKLMGMKSEKTDTETVPESEPTDA